MRKERRYFEWIAGDDIGEVVLLESMTEIGGELFYNFENGDTCNSRFIAKATANKADLKEKLMVEVDSPTNVWSIEKVESKVYDDRSMNGETVDIPTLQDILNMGQGGEVDSNLGTQTLTAPRRQVRTRELPDPKDWLLEDSEPIVEQHKVETESVAAQTYVEKEPEQNVVSREQKSIDVESQDPVFIMVRKSKTHSIEIPITLNIDLPSKSLYKIVSEEFENGGEKFIDFVVDGIDVSSIIESLKTSLKQAYEKED